MTEDKRRIGELEEEIAFYKLNDEEKKYVTDIIKQS